MFTAHSPADPAAFRTALYAGNIFRLPATPATKNLVRHLRALLINDFGADLEQLHERNSFADTREKLGTLRATLTRDARYLDILPVLAAVAGAAGELAFDPLRLRCVLHGNHTNKGAEVAYAAHRDTWYGNPQCQVNFWIPLQDVTEENSFLFYPALFDKPVDNTSAQFSYGEWMDKHGWQGSKSHAPVTFPTPLAQPEGGQAFTAKAGDIVVFSAAQLHQTVRNNSGLTRFSLDFRAVHLADHAAGRGAPNADNASRAEAFRDYLFPKGKAA